MAPRVDAALEPEPAPWSGALAADDIVDAELVGEDGRIIAPRSGAHDADPPAEGAVRAVAADGESAEPSKLAALTWSCKCGEIVSMAQGACSVCGSYFLGDLRDGSAGRHRPGNSALSWLPESRQVRVALAVFAAMAFSVLLTVVLSLFG